MGFIDNFLTCNTFSIISHKGGAGESPGNTMAAIKKSVHSTTDIIEIDVQQTKDGKNILFHDRSSIEITKADIPIQKFSYRELLSRVGYRDSLPTLEDALAEVDGKKGLYIDIKQPNIIHDIVEIIEEENAVDWTAIVGSYPYSLIHAKKYDPHITTGLSFEIVNRDIFSAKNFDIIMPKYNILSKDFVNKIANSKRKISTWTVNSIEDALTMYKLGVDGVATDYPTLLTHLRELISLERKLSTSPYPKPRYLNKITNLY